MAADRALFAAFQKVRADVDAALAETRRKEAELRAKEEAEALAARREKKRLRGRAPDPAAKTPQGVAPRAAAPSFLFRFAPLLRYNS